MKLLRLIICLAIVAMVSPAIAQKKTSILETAFEQLQQKLPKAYCPSNLIIIPKNEIKVSRNGDELIFEKMLFNSKGKVDDYLIQKVKCSDITSISVDKTALQKKYGGIIITVATMPDAIHYGYSEKKVDQRASTMVFDLCREVKVTEANDIINLFNQLRNCGR